MMTFHRTSLILLGLFSALLVHSQQFSFVNAGLDGVGRSSVAWGDYDADGDLDLLVTGNQGSGPYLASVYRNDNGSFNDINAGLTGIDNSSVAWGDYDNDGDLDILATGRSKGNTTTWLYRNKNGVFTSINVGFPDIGPYGCVAWSDYDGDGDLDALLSGGYFCYLFRNDGGAFTNINATLPAVSNSWVNFGDFDNDGDQDLFIAGDVGGWPVSAICRNDGGIFTELDSTGIMPFSSGSASWIDYDHDHDLDVLISGFDQYLEPKTSIFRNDGNLVFTNAHPGLAGAALGVGAWGDYDNDGDADILLTGQNAACGSLSSIVYRNDGNNNFTDINAALEGVERSSAAWGDYDNDGDLDILISGFNGSGQPTTRLYRNNSGSNNFSANTCPGPPANLNSELNDHKVSLHWDPSTDNTTPSAGISYNLRVGSFPGGQDVFAANADPVSSSRLIPQAGNVSDDTYWSLDLPDGDFYWSVQAIDHGFTASTFADEQAFTVSNVGLDEHQKMDSNVIATNPFTDKLVVSGTSSFIIEIYSSTGQLLYISGESALKHVVSSERWSSGACYIKFVFDDHTSSRLLLKL